MPSYEQRIFAFQQLGKELREMMDAKSAAWLDIQARAEQENGWFIPEYSEQALREIAGWLEVSTLEGFARKYTVEDESPKWVGLILAGNIPAVGFHDLMCVLLSGHKALVKTSSTDSVLPRFLLDRLIDIEAEFKSVIEYREGQMTGAEAYISTGSNNSARYFEHYFGKYPNIIRRNRHGIAVLDAQATEQDIRSLGKDVFTFFGLGCRNVSKLYLPEGFDVDRLYSVWLEYEWLIDHKKYYNNYHYHRTIYLLNKDVFFDNGFLILKEDSSLASPIGALHFEYYKDEPRIPDEEVQCRLGAGGLDYGSSQGPGISDFADGVDTMAFLKALHTAQGL